MNTAILIPARYNSSRFPGKPLVKLDGIPMIQRVYDNCKEAGHDTYVLTDDLRVFDLFGPNKCWIEEATYNNGTERCCGAIKNGFFKKYDQFINVQGDMPDVTLPMIKKCEENLKHYAVTTMAAWMPKENQNDINTVKLIRAGDKALWFGRGMTGYGDWHLGVYGYRRNALEMYNTLDVPQEELIESLEQLRWLKNGWDIGVWLTEFGGIEINTPEDTVHWERNHNQYDWSEW